MPSISAINMTAELKKKKETCMQKVLIFEKKKMFASWIQIRDLLNAGQLLYPLSNMAAVFDGMLLAFSPLLCLQPTAECNLITTFTYDDKLEVER